MRSGHDFHATTPWPEIPVFCIPPCRLDCHVPGVWLPISGGASTFDNEVIATDVDGGVGWTLAAVAIDSIVRIEHPGMHKSFEIPPW